MSWNRPAFLARPGRTLFRLLLASFIVGLLMSVFGLRPEALLHSLGAVAGDLFDRVVGALRWAVPYVLLGAVIVGPIWLVLTLLRALRGR